MTTLSKLLKGIILLGMVVLIGSCGDKGGTLKTIEVRPAFVRTLVAEQYPSEGWLFCPFGAAAYDDPGPQKVMVGYDHMVNESSFCRKASDHIYQGAVWFPISEVIGHNLVTKAILKFSRDEGDFDCLVKLCRSDNAWVMNSGRNSVSVSACITPLRHQGDEYAIDVSHMVYHWAIFPSSNNGFIFVGPKENFDSFSIKGMPSFEGCSVMLQNFRLEITYSEPNP